MRILITNHWFKKMGGSETFTYTLGEELKRRGHEVDLFTNIPGEISRLMARNLGIPLRCAPKYDLILANHKTCVNHVFNHSNGHTVQTCHGTTPQLEQPSLCAHQYVAISEEVQAHLKTVHQQEATLIRNGINCQRFTPAQPLGSRVRTILSLCHGEEANRIIARACDILGIKLLVLNKYQEAKFNVETYINQADMVISLGRGIYEAMACGRPVIVFDSRSYQTTMGDGYLMPGHVADVAAFNCSGRYLRLPYTAHELVAEIKKYDPAHGAQLRQYALDHFNITKTVDQYFNLV